MAFVCGQLRCCFAFRVSRSSRGPSLQERSDDPSVTLAGSGMEERPTCVHALVLACVGIHGSTREKVRQLSVSTGERKLERFRDIRHRNG